jgi:hypothetical protein
MAERPVVWIRHRAGERCAGSAAEVFPGDFVQVTRETGILATGAGARAASRTSYKRAHGQDIKRRAKGEK